MNPDDPIGTDDDLDLFAEVGHRPGRTTVALVAGIVTALAFIGGVAVQKHFGGTGAVGGTGPVAAGLAGRARGSLGAGGGFGGGFGAGQPAGGQASRTAAATPVVVGTVTKLSGNRLTVKNLGGKTVAVKVPEGATVTLVAGKRLVQLAAGATVSVAGTTAADGTVTASSVTVRS
jgi:hypothetical protein